MLTQERVYRVYSILKAIWQISLPANRIDREYVHILSTVAGLFIAVVITFVWMGTPFSLGAFVGGVAIFVTLAIPCAWLLRTIGWLCLAFPNFAKKALKEWYRSLPHTKEKRKNAIPLEPRFMKTPDDEQLLIVDEDIALVKKRR